MSRLEFYNKTSMIWNGSVDPYWARDVSNDPEYWEWAKDTSKPAPASYIAFYTLLKAGNLVCKYPNILCE